MFKYRSQTHANNIIVNLSLLKKIDAFSAQSDPLSALKVKRLQPNFAIFLTCFFSPTVKTLQNPNLARIR